MAQTREGGQFIPISAMVMFTTVVFLAAVFDIYQVSRAKLKVQNLADAVALNIASQMASSMNKVTDLNEWMNHMVDLGPNAQPSLPGQLPNCRNLNPKLLPPISCAENATKSNAQFMFNLKGDAAAYAQLIQKINQTQQLFIDTYNNFMGAGVKSNSSSTGNASLNSILFADIPELADPGTSVIVWNRGAPPPDAPVSNDAANVPAQTPSLDTSGMQNLKFTIHDIPVTYKTVIPLGPLGSMAGPSVVHTLGELLTTSAQNIAPVGWMEPDSVNQPSIQVTTRTGLKYTVGAGATVKRTIQILALGTVTVKATAQAYVVEGSGQTATMVIDPSNGVQRPVFKPTYWVKLAGS